MFFAACAALQSKLSGGQPFAVIPQPVGPPLPHTGAKPEQLVIGTLQDFPNFEPKKSCGDMRVRSECVCARVLELWFCHENYALKLVRRGLTVLSLQAELTAAKCVRRGLCEDYSSSFLPILQGRTYSMPKWLGNFRELRRPRSGEFFVSYSLPSIPFLLARTLSTARVLPQRRSFLRAIFDDGV